MDYVPPFGRWIRLRRRALDLTQAQLAQAMGYSTIAVRKVESGGNVPSRDMAARFAECLDVPQADREGFIAFARGTLAHRPPVTLPSPLTSFVGRDEDLAALVALLQQPEARLITLLGPPGVGKTRLAIEAARQLAPAFADGVCFVPLAPVRSADHIAAAVAHALGVRHDSRGGLDLSDVVKPLQVLLVLDNFEHLMAGALTIADLLAACTRMTLLVTSRAPLRLSAERVFELAPLALPSTAATGCDELAANPAVRLFVDRARAAKASFVLTDANAASVAAICVALDGLPLAIELAAARARMFAPQTLLSRLSQHSGLALSDLAGGPRDLPARQQSLRATLDWSYSLLSPEEGRLCRRMGVFAGPASLAAIAQVCGDVALEQPGLAQPDDSELPSGALIDALQTLIDHHLVHVSPGSGSDTRYAMIDIVRDYALAQLEAAGELAMLQQHHAAYDASLAAHRLPDESTLGALGAHASG